MARFGGGGGDDSKKSREKGVRKCIYQQMAVIHYRVPCYPLKECFSANSTPTIPRVIKGLRALFVFLDGQPSACFYIFKWTLQFRPYGVGMGSRQEGSGSNPAVSA